MESFTYKHTVADLLRRSYRANADSVAMIGDDGRETTYGELGQLAARVAGGLAELGVNGGDRVVLALRNSPEFFMLDHALFWGGYVRVALSFRLHPIEIVSITKNAGAKVIVVDPEILAEVSDLVATERIDATVLSSAGEGAGTVAGLTTAAPIEPFPSQLSELSWMPYTSGTTGNPKGVMHTHASILATMRNMFAEFPSAGTQDTLLQAAPMSHLAGWVGLAYSIRGARVLFLREFDAETALDLIERYGVTVTPVVPTIINFLTERVETDGRDISSLQTIIYAGSPMAPERVARAIRAFGSIFIQCYGLTELPMPLTILSKHDHTLLPDGSVPKHLASAGRVTPFLEVRLVDDDGNEVAEGEPGEIQVRADNIMRGYWNLPEESEAFALEGGWRASGDVGRFDDDYLYILDRKRDLIVSGGFNVFPGEVEAAITTIPGVAEVAVVGVPDPKWGETVLAVVVRETGSDVDEGAIKDACRLLIAGYKQPRRIEFVNELPRNIGGKLLRKELRAKYWQGGDRAVGG